LTSEYYGFRLKPNRSKYLNSCQASVWNRKILIERLKGNHTAWEWELMNVDSPYKHYVNSSDYIIDYGYRGHWFGIRKGKWVKEDVVPLFEKEQTQIDFTERGFYEET